MRRSCGAALADPRALEQLSALSASLMLKDCGSQRQVDADYLGMFAITLLQ